MSAKKKAIIRQTSFAPEETPEAVQFLQGEAVKNARACHVDALKTDPFGADGYGDIFGALVLGKATTEQRRFAGESFCQLVKNLDSQTLENVFRRIVEMKQEAERINQESAHRNARAYAAYDDFIQQHKKEPSKFQLKNHIKSNSHKFGGGFPYDDDKKAWTRIWKSAGLKNLKSK